MQSVNIRVPGLESSISSGEVNTLPVTSSKWIVSVGEGQKLVWESVEGTMSTTNKIIFDIMIGKNIKAGLLEAMYFLRPPSQPFNKKQDQPQGGFRACGCLGGWCATGAGWSVLAMVVRRSPPDKLSTNERDRSAPGPQHRVSWRVSAHIECFLDPKWIPLFP